MQKMIHGWVVQEWDEKLKKFTSQDFSADDGSIEYLDEDGEIVFDEDLPEELQKDYLPMHMVQPGEDYFELDMTTIMEAGRIALSKKSILDEMDISDECAAEVLAKLEEFMNKS